MSKTYQSVISNELELPKYSRSRTSINMHMQRSFRIIYWSVIKSGNATKPGFGYILTYNFVYDIFQSRNIDINTYMFGQQKTQFNKCLQI